MIISVEGKLAAFRPGFAVIEVGGVGLKVLVPGSTASHLPPTGERTKLYTSLQVREDSLTLYGFLTEPELDLFGLLLGVSGLGPAKALALLSASSVDALRSDIARENTVALMRIPGVGRKLAGQIVLDLKSRMGSVAAAGEIAAPSDDDGDILSWLVSMGFSAPDAQRAVSRLPRDASLSSDQRALKALAFAREG